MTPGTPETAPPIDLDAETRPEGADGSYRMEIPHGWEGAPGIPYGGWTVAVALRAAGLEAQRHRPASLSAQFLRPLGMDAPLDLEVEILRRGRRTETIRVGVSQHGKLGLHAVVTTTEDAPGHEFGPEAAPTPPAREGMPTLAEIIDATSPEPLPDGHHIRHYEYRVPGETDPETLRGADGRHSLMGWLRYGDDLTYDAPFVEAARYCIPADTQVPAAFLRAGMLNGPPEGYDGPMFRATTLDLMIHFHRTEPSTDWLWYETHVQVGHNGLASGVCNLWSEDRTLLATSMSQVAFLPFAP